MGETRPVMEPPRFRQSSSFHDDTLSLHISPARRLPDFLQQVNLKYVKLGYHYLIKHLVIPILIPPLLIIFLEVRRMGVNELWKLWESMQFNLVSVIIYSALIVFSGTMYVMSRPQPIYLVDFSCYLPDGQYEVPLGLFIERSRKAGYFDDRCIEFQEKVLERSGLGEKTYFPPAMFHVPPKISTQAAREESAAVIFGCLDELFEKTKITPKDVGILVVNCSLFNPTPSLASMIVNKYKMRGNIRTYNLGGMGCSASIIAIDLAKDMLQVQGNTYAIVVSTENITQNCYTGKKKSMLVPNCLFRVGGAAILLSNKRKDRKRSKYKLNHVVRTHKGADEKCYRCAYQEQDEEGKMGVSLSKDIMTIAVDALKSNITTLGPLVLPISEQILFYGFLVARDVFHLKVKLYVPDFKLAFNHFCIHAGGRAVIDKVEKNLKLTPEHCEPSRMTLHRFGNTSSSSIWYSLAYTEAKGRMRKGNRVWQIAFGSGFKCNSAVWQALRNIEPSKHSPWAHCIDEYPVHIKDAEKPLNES